LIRRHAIPPTRHTADYFVSPPPSFFIIRFIATTPDLRDLLCRFYALFRHYATTDVDDDDAITPPFADYRAAAAFMMRHQLMPPCRC